MIEKGSKLYEQEVLKLLTCADKRQLFTEEQLKFI